MASALPDKPNDDDLESVAESLLGIDFSGAGAIPDSIELDDDDLFADDDETPAVESSDDTTEPQAREPQAEPLTRTAPDDDDSEFGFGLDIEDELDDISFADEPVRQSDSAREERYVEPEIEIESESASAEPAETPVDSRRSRTKDDFWDALEGWDWDDEAKESKGSAGGGRRHEEPQSERTREPERTPRPAARQEESIDDDFGADLADDRRATPPFQEREPEGDRPREERPRHDEGRESRRRGGRRGARSESDDRRGGRERPRRDDRPAREQRPVREERPAPRPRAEPEPAAFDDEDAGGFGEGLDLEAPSSSVERPPREQEASQGDERRGRRRGRGRGRGRDRDREPRSPEPAVERPVPADESDFDSDDAFGAEEEAAAPEEELQESRFQDVPTWEEAISYLVRPKAKSGSASGSGSHSESGSSEGSRRSSDEERDRPRRRGGRRGGSRRPRD